MLKNNQTDINNPLKYFQQSVIANLNQNNKRQEIFPGVMQMITPKTPNLGVKQLDTKKLFETDKLLDKAAAGSYGFDPSKLSAGFSIGSAGLDLIGSVASPLDHVSGASKALDIGSKVAEMIPVPWVQGISLGLKAIKTLDQLTGKKAVSQQTLGETATGYNLDFNANANTSYGGLFGNKKRKQANKLTSFQDFQNIGKIRTAKAAEKELLASGTSTQDILSKNYQRLTGGLGTNILAAKEGLKLIRQKAKFLKEGGAFNVIPSGALHRELNHLEGEHTKKGIPVLLEEGGEILQQAEIEREELILHKELTDKLEQLLKDYDNGNELALIEAGKLLTSEILENTQDNVGLLNKIE